MARIEVIFGIINGSSCLKMHYLVMQQLYGIGKVFNLSLVRFCANFVFYVLQQFLCLFSLLLSCCNLVTRKG